MGLLIISLLISCSMTLRVESKIKSETKESSEESTEENSEGVILTHGLNNNAEYKAKMAKRKFTIDMSMPIGSIGRQCGYSSQVSLNSNMVSESSNYQGKHPASEALYIKRFITLYTYQPWKR